MQAVTYGPTGAKTVATATGEGVGIVPPAVSGDGVTIPWGSRDESGTDSPVLLTFAAIPLSYRLDRPEEVVRVDGYLDGILRTGMQRSRSRDRTPSRPWPMESPARSSGSTGATSPSRVMGESNSTVGFSGSMRQAGLPVPHRPAHIPAPTPRVSTTSSWWGVTTGTPRTCSCGRRSSGLTALAA